MNIGIIGGTGKEGVGLAIRWARAGHKVVIGSREAEKGRAKAKELSDLHGVTIEGGDNRQAVTASEIVLLAVPYSSHTQTLTDLKADLAGKILIDITVPLQPPKVAQVNLPPGQAAALEAQALLGPETKVVATLHHVSSAHLGNVDHEVDCDVLVCGDDEAAKDVVVGLIKDMGLRGIKAGMLRNAIALEAFTSVLLAINKTYGAVGSGIRITALPPQR